MDKVRRKRYLKALGIETWQTRSAGADVSAVSPAEPSSAVTSPPRRDTARPQPPPAAPPRRPAAAAAEGIRPAPAMTETPLAPAAIAAMPRADIPADWPGLRAVIKDCHACKLCKTRTNTVFGVGAETSPLMIVGEGPGADEDARGEPFVGRAGKLLDEMLKAIGRSRGEPDDRNAVFIANVVKCRPPGNRDPEADEVEACRPYLDRQIELVRPKLIVALGRIAAQRLLDTDAPLSRLRGPIYHYGEARTPVFVTYHPAYLLRSPREKAKSWDDLKKIHRFLQGQA